MKLNNPSNLHLVCTAQAHTCGMTTEKQLESISQARSASANYLLKLVSDIDRGSNSSQTKSEEDNSSKDKEPGLKSTFSSHAEVSISDALSGFTEFDSHDVDSTAYVMKHRAYENVRQNYPDIDNLIRDEKVRALKELNRVGFRYYTIKVTAFVEKDGIIKTVSSKSHHTLERPSQEYLNNILTKVFKGSLITDSRNADGIKDFHSGPGDHPDA